MSNILLVDVGGTNLRYAYASEGLKSIENSKKISLDSVKNFENLIGDLINNSNVKNLVISAAGPKMYGTISMTNRDISVNENNLISKFNLNSCDLLNDWESIGYSLSDIDDKEIKFIKEGKPFNNTTFFIGPGTGLGAAVSVEGRAVMATEVGNTSGLTQQLLNNYNISDGSSFTALESVVSGSAISKIFSIKTGNNISSEEVVKLYRDGDIDAIEVIDGFTKSLAEVISDLALTFISGNGIYLAGSLMRTITELMDKDLFIKQFLDNKLPQHRKILELMPIGIINREHACLLGNLNYFNSK